MKPYFKFRRASILVLLAMGMRLLAQSPDDLACWNLSELFPSLEAYKEASARFVEDFSSMDKYPGTLADSPKNLLHCLEDMTQFNIRYTRLFTYINLLYDSDMRVSAHQTLKQNNGQIGGMLSEKLAFVTPEIIRMGEERVASFIAQDEKRFKPYSFFLKELFRTQAHIGSEAVERVLSLAEGISSAPRNILDAFLYTDFPYPQLVAKENQSVTLNENEYGQRMRSSNRDERKQAFMVYMGGFHRYRNTFGALLNAQLQRDLFNTKTRGYSSCLEMVLDEEKVPREVFTGMIERVNRNLPVFHRYLKLKARMLAVDRLHFYDFNAQSGNKLEISYSLADARRIIPLALAPLGKDYVDRVELAFRDHWIDAEPREGKRPGGYANGWAYQVHPYILFNFRGEMSDLRGLAHELGHAMQSDLSNKAQPFDLAHCPRSVTEVSATVNEALLIEHLLMNSDRTPSFQLALMASYLDGVALTVFKAAMISEFELRIHQLAEQSEQMSGDDFNRIYLELVRKYYGHGTLAFDVDEETQSGWSYIPQLFHPFYAYEYVTAFTASSSLSEQILKGDRKSRDRFLRFLSAGGSDYAVNLLREAGVDMLSDEPLNLTMNKMNRFMDRMEKILGK